MTKPMELMKRINYKKWQQHLSYWALYAVYFYVLNVLGNEQVTPLTVILSLPYFAGLFYGIVFILNRCFPKGRYIRGTLVLLIFYGISSLFVFLLTDGDRSLSLVYGAYLVSDYTFNLQEFAQTLLVMHGHFSLLAFLYFHYHGKLAEEQKKLTEMEGRLKAEEQKHHYEYVALAAQVSPHMMANIIQGWSGQLTSTSPKVAQQMMDVYELLTFYMRAHEVDGPKTILLHDEVKAVEQFIAAHREVLEKPVFVDFRAKGNLYRFSIPPTTILTLVKNAFKHGDVHSAEYPLRVELEVQRNSYAIKVQNKKQDKGEPTLRSHGTGLRALKRRLDLAFGDRATCRIEDNNERDHSVEIEVDFKIYENERRIIT